MREQGSTPCPTSTSRKTIHHNSRRMRVYDLPFLGIEEHQVLMCDVILKVGPLPSLSCFQCISSVRQVITPSINCSHQQRQVLYLVLIENRYLKDGSNRTSSPPCTRQLEPAQRLSTTSASRDSEVRNRRRTPSPPADLLVHLHVVSPPAISPQTHA